jgi:hypothetical protein
MGKQEIYSLPHTPAYELLTCAFAYSKRVQSSSCSAFIPTLTEALERGTSRLSVNGFGGITHPP